MATHHALNAVDPATGKRIGRVGAIHPDGGGCEDPRITFVEPLGRYVMTYTAFSPDGPRIALAVSDDLLHWQRLGLATFEPYDGLEFNGVNNKDALVFPVAVPDPDGRPAMAMIHRPLFPGTDPQDTATEPATRTVEPDREGRYRLVKEIVVDPHSSVLLMRTRLEILDPMLRGKLHLYGLLAPT